ncbi:hypothetical protein KW795_02430 [Candidatus Microgenomates bacterium]|nr:hypothetical protein [Candidatus Microgenomates bacterium]
MSLELLEFAGIYDFANEVTTIVTNESDETDNQNLPSERDILRKFSIVPDPDHLGFVKIGEKCVDVRDCKDALAIVCKVFENSKAIKDLQESIRVNQYSQPNSIPETMSSIDTIHILESKDPSQFFILSTYKGRGVNWLEADRSYALEIEKEAIQANLKLESCLVPDIQELSLLEEKIKTSVFELDSFWR